jgi:hypothetical protein
VVFEGIGASTRQAGSNIKQQKGFWFKICSYYFDLYQGPQKNNRFQQSIA